MRQRGGWRGICVQIFNKVLFNDTVSEALETVVPPVCPADAEILTGDLW